ncbi:MAG TPA: hypothetical protein PLQ58_04415, partial [Smithellaceae bacterium]|nr:hypothetical protein [Smithellaceae bacterium]
MEKYNNIIDIIKKQEAISPPDDIVQKIMEGAEKAEESFGYKLYRLLFQRRRLSPDAKSILAGNIVSPVQCFFLLFIVGLFYLLLGLSVIIGMRDLLTNANINLWLRFQPYLTLISGLFIIYFAFSIKKKPQTIIFAKYGIIAHSIFLIINALILEFVLVFPVAMAFLLALSLLAVFLGILLVSSINN